VYAERKLRREPEFLNARVCPQDTVRVASSSGRMRWAFADFPRRTNDDDSVGSTANTDGEKRKRRECAASTSSSRNHSPESAPARPLRARTAEHGSNFPHRAGGHNQASVRRSSSTRVAGRTRDARLPYLGAPIRDPVRSPLHKIPPPACSMARPRNIATFSSLEGRFAERRWSRECRDAGETRNRAPVCGTGPFPLPISRVSPGASSSVGARGGSCGW